jgi:hypothetical protein
MLQSIKSSTNFLDVLYEAAQSKTTLKQLYKWCQEEHWCQTQYGYEWFASAVKGQGYSVASDDVIRTN